MSEPPGNFGAAWRQQRERSRVRRDQMHDAIAAARAASAGKGRDEVRELIAHELQARGLRRPDAPILDHMTDRVLTDPVDLIGQLRLRGRGLSLAAGIIATSARGVKDLFTTPGPHLHLGDANPLIVAGEQPSGTADVILDAAAQQLLNPGGEHDLTRADEIFVLLSDAENGHVAVQAGDHHVGILTDAAADRFRAVLDQGRSEHRPVVTVAARERAPDGSWRLSIYFPDASD